MVPITPNWVATAALLMWPLISFWLYRTQSVGRATIWTILWGQLLLPAAMEFKISMIPAFDKDSIPALCALVFGMIALRRPIRFVNGFGLPEILVLTFVFSPLITGQLNDDQIRNGGIIQAAVGLYDGGSSAMAKFVTLIPFFVGRQLLRGGEDHAEILRALVIAGLVYSVPMLFEIRMSPQLSEWIYGYYASGFDEQMRYGGFRPVVFMVHGLTLAFFTMTTILAAATLWRTRERVRIMLPLPPAGVVAYLSGVLVLCKTLGTITYGIVLVPLIRWASLRTQLRVAMLLVTIAVSYPILRSLDLVPTNLIVETAATINSERAGSLATRFTNEHALLERASQRFWFGWGRFGRSHIYDDYGSEINPPDGGWIVTMGEYGFVGFFAQFALFALVVYRAASALKFVDTAKSKVHFAALSLIVAIYVFNLLPNASLYGWTWLLVGALLGRAELLRARSTQYHRVRRENVYTAASPGQV